eukprot:TRINITY_DN20631_c0_g1_i6.p1 TRINITY_DN20631_c0_g1~~TRINITY_DN20631_c0_g1_i6.p1  ORF type:complete len:514 (-),score=32.13 TRINITY_DN20631_c0_g1_i6:248-1624(-)
MLRSLVGSEMCIRDRVSTQSTGTLMRHTRIGLLVVLCTVAIFTLWQPLSPSREHNARPDLTLGARVTKQVGYGAYLTRHLSVPPSRSVMLSTSIPPGLLAYLRRSRWSNASTASGLLAAGFARNDDYRVVNAEHQYFEAFFHGLSTPSPHRNSHHPRGGSLVGPMDKPAAPLEFRAFLRAFRAANQPWIAAIFNQTRAAPHVNRNPLLAGIFRDTDRAFSDLAVQVIANMPGLRTIALQVHLGAAVPPGQVRWHFDGPNSLLHMAISLQGSRNLHYILSQDPTNTVRELFWYPPIVTQGRLHTRQRPRIDLALQAGSTTMCCLSTTARCMSRPRSHSVSGRRGIRSLADGACGQSTGSSIRRPIGACRLWLCSAACCSQQQRRSRLRNSGRVGRWRFENDCPPRWRQPSSRSPASTKCSPRRPISCGMTPDPTHASLGVHFLRCVRACVEKTRGLECR